MIFRDNYFALSIIVVMTPESQHQYFDTAYRTGSDIWTQTPIS